MVKSTYRQYWESGTPPAADEPEHTYAGATFSQNTDGSSSYGSVWHWAGSGGVQSHGAPLKSPNADTAGQDGYNLADNKSPQRRTYLSPTAAGDERLLYGQGRPMAYLSSGGGSGWATGLTGDDAGGAFTVESRFEFSGTVAPADLSRATDVREKGRIGITGTAYAYAGASGRVTSEALGRDLNPLGRGDGRAYVAGGLNLGQLYPALPQNLAQPGTGNSVNNGCPPGTRMVNYQGTLGNNIVL